MGSLREQFPRDNLDTQSWDTKDIRTKSAKVPEKGKPLRLGMTALKDTHKAGTRTELTSVFFSIPGKQMHTLKISENIFFALFVVHVGSFPPSQLPVIYLLLKRQEHAWGPEQIFWMNVACKDNATKVKHESLIFPHKGKANKGITFSTLKWQ